MPRKTRDEQELDETLNPNDHYDARTGVGKDPDTAGKRADESDLDPLGDDPSDLRGA